jgi:hypothetical protein
LVLMTVKVAANELAVKLRRDARPVNSVFFMARVKMKNAAPQL